MSYLSACVWSSLPCPSSSVKSELQSPSSPLVFSWQLSAPETLSPRVHDGSPSSAQVCSWVLLSKAEEWPRQQWVTGEGQRWVRGWGTEPRRDEDSGQQEKVGGGQSRARGCVRRKEWKRSWEEVGLLSLRAQHHHSRTIRSVLRQDGHGIKGVSTETSHGRLPWGADRCFGPHLFIVIFRTYLCIWLHPVLICGTWDLQLRRMRSLDCATCDLFQLRHGIFSCGTWDLQLRHMRSLVAAHVISSCATWDLQLRHM